MTTNKSSTPRYAGIEVPASFNADQLAFAEAIKERLEQHSGDRGNPKDRFVTMRDLERAGIARVDVKNKYATARASSSLTGAITSLSDVDVGAAQLSLLAALMAASVGDPTELKDSQQVIILDPDQILIKRYNINDFIGLRATSDADIVGMWSFSNTLSIDNEIYLDGEIGVEGDLMLHGGEDLPMVWHTPGDIMKVDDTNVTLTLTGTPAGSLLQDVYLTLGWTGVLAQARGGTSFATYAPGDLLYADAAGNLAKLSVEDDDDVLTLEAGLPVWKPGGGGSASPLTTIGDLYTFSTVNDRLAVGDDDEILSADSSEPTGLKWIPNLAKAAPEVRGASFSGGLTPIIVPTNNVPINIREDCTIIGVVVLTQGGTGSCVIDIWKSAYGAYPPTVLNTITAAAKPTISSGVKYTDSTLTGWTTALSAGDTLLVKMDSCSVFTAVSIFLVLAPVGSVALDGYTDERVQDVVATALTDTATVLWSYDDSGALITADVDTTALDLFTDMLAGIVPASGGDADEFLCADGTWKEPPGTGGSGSAVDWDDYTPTFSGWVNGSAGGNITGRWIQVGDIVTVFFGTTANATTAGTNTAAVLDLPVAMIAGGASPPYRCIGTCTARSTTGGDHIVSGQVLMNGSSGDVLFAFIPTASSAAYQVIGSFSYQAASTASGAPADSSHGSYTPTISAQSVTMTHNGNATYVRVGSQVTVRGSIECVVASVPAGVSCLLTVPIASNFGDAGDACGCFNDSDIVFGAGMYPGVVMAEPTGNTVGLHCQVPTTTGTRIFSYTFTYEII